MTIPMGAEQSGPQFAIVDLSLIGDHTLGALDLRVAIAVAACLNGKTRAGQTTEEMLVALTGSTRAKVSAAIRKLEHREHMTVLRQRGFAGRYFANRYRMPANEGSSAFVPLAWAFHPELARNAPALKILVFCAKEAGTNGLFLSMDLPHNHPDSRIRQSTVAAGGTDVRTAIRGWRKLAQLGALTRGWAPLAGTVDGGVGVDWDAIDPMNLEGDRSNLDCVGNLMVLRLSRPPHRWPAQEKRAEDLGYMAGIFGGHGEPPRDTRQTTSGDMVNQHGGQNQPRSFSTGLPAPGISAPWIQPMADASILNGGQGASTEQNFNEAGEATMELLSKALVVKAKSSFG